MSRRRPPPHTRAAALREGGRAGSRAAAQKTRKHPLRMEGQGREKGGGGVCSREKYMTQILIASILHQTSYLYAQLLAMTIHYYITSMQFMPTCNSTVTNHSLLKATSSRPNNEKRADQSSALLLTVKISGNAANCTSGSDTFSRSCVFF